VQLSPESKNSYPGMVGPKEQLDGAGVKLEGFRVVMLPHSSIPHPSSLGLHGGCVCPGTWQRLALSLLGASGVFAGERLSPGQHP